MRDELGRFVDGSHGIDTRFQKGEHWRPRKPYWNKAWLYNEYIKLGRSSSEIAADFGITQGAIQFWLNKHNIPTRTVSQARELKHWGSTGKDNPMYGRTGEDNPNWKGGITPERQKVYSSRRWKNAVKAVWRRDKATCQKCGKLAGKRGGDNFHIHHIKPFEHEETRTDANNLILLCTPCHHWVHSIENTQGLFIND